MKGGGGKRRRPSPSDHPCSLTPKEARELQLSLRGRLRFPPLGRPPRTVAGADISHLRFGRRAVAGVVVLSFPDLEVIEESLAVGEASFPYVPGLLSFREGPLLERAFGGLSRMLDLIFFDGQGIAHLRRLGIASHLGLRLGVPSVGCAKSRLWGEARGTGRGKRGMGTSESARRRGRGSGLQDTKRSQAPSMSLRVTESTWRARFSTRWPSLSATGFPCPSGRPISAPTRSAAGWELSRRTWPCPHQLSDQRGQ